MLEEETSNLVELGLTVLQARAYVTLLQLGTARAARLAAAMEIVKPEIYRILRDLATRGLVQRNLTSPATFTAIPAEMGLNLLTRQLRDRLDNFERRKKDLVKSLSLLAPTPSDSEHRTILLETYEKSDQIFRRMLAEARHEYVGVTGKQAFMELVDDGIARAIVSAKKRRVHVRIIADIDDSNSRSAEFLSRHVELRRSQNTLFYIDIVDKKEMLFGSVYLKTDQAKRRKESDLWTTNPRFIEGMHAMFENLWKVSPKYFSSSRIPATRKQAQV